MEIFQNIWHNQKKNQGDHSEEILPKYKENGLTKTEIVEGMVLELATIQQADNLSVSVNQKEVEERYDELYGKLISDSKLYGININEDDFVKPHWYIYDRFDNNSYKELINASDNIKNLGNVFPLIFFCIAILVSLISMMRMIEEDRTENGSAC